MTTKHSPFLLTLLGLSILGLGACQTATTSEISAKQERSEKIAAAIRRAEAASGMTRSLQSLEQRYKQNTGNEMAAAQYAHALRTHDYLPEAAAVLEPFAKDEKTSAATKTEYASALLEQGKTKEAEKIAQKAIMKDEKYDRAYLVLGIALDTQKMHKEAERAFRKGLELWTGDPTIIMNNLALNLASQNHLEEAAEILQKAKTIAPYRPEIERNLRIITALQQSKGIQAPKPSEKPEFQDTSTN